MSTEDASENYPSLRERTALYREIAAHKSFVTWWTTLGIVLTALIASLIHKEKPEWAFVVLVVVVVGVYWLNIMVLWFRVRRGLYGNRPGEIDEIDEWLSSRDARAKRARFVAKYLRTILLTLVLCTVGCLVSMFFSSFALAHVPFEHTGAALGMWIVALLFLIDNPLEVEPLRQHLQLFIMTLVSLAMYVLAYLSLVSTTLVSPA